MLNFGDVIHISDSISWKLTAMFYQIRPSGSLYKSGKGFIIILPSGKLTWLAGISPFSIGNTSSIRVQFPASYVSLPECRFFRVEFQRGLGPDMHSLGRWAIWKQWVKCTSCHVKPPESGLGANMTHRKHLISYLSYLLTKKHHFWSTFIVYPLLILNKKTPCHTQHKKKLKHQALQLPIRFQNLCLRTRLTGHNFSLPQTHLGWEVGPPNVPPMMGSSGERWVVFFCDGIRDSHQKAMNHNPENNNNSNSNSNSAATATTTTTTTTTTTKDTLEKKNSLVTPKSWSVTSDVFPFQIDRVF